MYYLIVYDITCAKRLVKALKICRKYLTWIQNSVFEGELSQAQFSNLKRELKNVIDTKKDSVIIFGTQNIKFVDRQVLGVEKNEKSFFI